MDRTLHQISAMRRMRASLLLPLLLILSQHGAWLHELSHVAYAAHPLQVAVQQAQDSPESGVCSGCQSFGQLSSALASAVAAMAAPVIQLCPRTEPRYSNPAAQLPAPRNRGPPLPA
jgi:hypothetical protein